MQLPCVYRLVHSIDVTKHNEFHIDNLVYAIDDGEKDELPEDFVNLNTETTEKRDLARVTVSPEHHPAF